MARTVFRHRMFDVELAPVQTRAGEAEFVRPVHWVVLLHGSKDFFRLALADK